jgi:hypothetical protein
MAVALHSYKVDADGEIRVRHTFYADTEEEADRLLEQHAAGCKAFGPAFEEGDTIELIEDIDAEDLPDAEELRDLEDAADGDEEDEPEEEEAADAE